MDTFPIADVAHVYFDIGSVPFYSNPVFFLVLCLFELMMVVFIFGGLMIDVFESISFTSCVTLICTNQKVIYLNANLRILVGFGNIGSNT